MDRPITVPPRGAVTDVERRCSRLLGINEDGSERLCGEPSVIHIAWMASSPIEPGWACQQHAVEVVSEWNPFQLHATGPDCGMPGSRWDVGNNCCRCEGTPEMAPPEHVETMVAA